MSTAKNVYTLSLTSSKRSSRSSRRCVDRAVHETIDDTTDVVDDADRYHAIVCELLASSNSLLGGLT